MADNIENAFHNAEKLLRSAYALSDPTSELLNLIKAHPTELAIRGLYFEAVEGNPSRAYTLTSVLVIPRDSPDAPVIESGLTLAEAFYDRLQTLFLEVWILTRITEPLAP